MSDRLQIAREVLNLEIAGLEALRDSLGEEFATAVGLLSNAPGRIAVSGMGKSGHVARKIAATFSSTGSPAAFVHPAEASHGDLGMISPDDVILALSKSGETQELGDLLAFAARFSIPLIAITGNAMEVDRKRCLDSGFADFLKKPFRIQNFLEVLHSHL